MLWRSGQGLLSILRSRTHVALVPIAAVHKIFPPPRSVRSSEPPCARTAMLLTEEEVGML